MMMPTGIDSPLLAQHAIYKAMHAGQVHGEQAVMAEIATRGPISCGICVTFVAVLLTSSPKSSLCMQVKSKVKRL